MSDSNQQQPDDRPILYWDVNIKTDNPQRYAFVVVEGRDEEEAVLVATNAAKLRWPENEVTECKVTPSKTNRKQRRGMGLK